MATVLERTLKEKVIVNENGKRKVVTKLEAALKQLANQAASGQPRAMQLLTTLLRSAEDRAIAAPAPAENLDEADKKVFLGIVKRLETYDKGAEENAEEPETK
jgi:phosphoenolpyruvate carboxylase